MGTRSALIVVGCLLAAPFAPWARAADAPRESLARFPTGEVAVVSATAVHTFKVWVADTEAHREQGLMWVRSLKPAHGMLFLFEAPQVASFWMKNTLIPLDLLFIAADGRIIRIAENAAPLSLATIGSMGVVRGVLEVPGGTSQRLGFQPGDYLRHAAFASR